jgi:hypothetical protein
MIKNTEYKIMKNKRPHILEPFVDRESPVIDWYYTKNSPV